MIQKYKTVVPLDSNSKLVSLDVSSLFTSLPSDFTIDVILQQIYRETEIVTNITPNELKELLLLSTKNVHFSLMDNFIYKKMILECGPIRVSHSCYFMAELEKKFITNAILLFDKLEALHDGTTAYVKTDVIDHVLSILNSFHENISFTYEQEINGKISFLDILSLRNGSNFETIIHLKSTHNDFYYIENQLHQTHGNETHLEH